LPLPSCHNCAVDTAKFQHGIELFNAGSFFDAHEALEDVWRELQGEQKEFLQAVIQCAVGLHHYSTGNIIGARSLLARASRKLAEYPSAYCGIAVEPLRLGLGEWTASLAAGGPPPAPLRLEAGATISPPVKNSAVKAPALRAVPLLDLRRQYAEIRREVEEALERVAESQQFILSDEVAAFESEAAAYLGTCFVAGCASGTDALWLALVACGVGPGDEVITSGFSFFSSVAAIVRAGARPVLMDIDPRTLNLDAALVERRITRSLPAGLRALLPVHLYGQCADMDAFGRIAAEHRLAIVEDAAQAFGALWRGRRAGTLGAAGAFSFYPTKNLGAFGDAGCVATGDGARAERIRRLRNLGMPERYRHEEIGANSRLDALQAAVLRVKLRRLERWNAQRRERAAEYDRLLASSGVVAARATSLAPVRLLEILPQAHHIFHQYVIRASRRDELRAFLASRQIGTEVYYPLPLHMQKCFSYLGYREGDLPESERAAREVLALPMFPELTADEQRYVVESVAEFYS
jgi:dTDP-4-amino-4,6-dideoxygalactose transaminase